MLCIVLTKLQEVLRYPVLGRAELPEIIRQEPITLTDFNTLIGQKLDKGKNGCQYLMLYFLAFL